MQNLRNLTRRIFRLTNRGTETARDADYTLGESYRRDDLVTHDASQEPMGEPWARWRGPWRSTGHQRRWFYFLCFWEWTWPQRILILGEGAAVVSAGLSFFVSGWPVPVAALLGSTALLIYASRVILYDDVLDRATAHQVRVVVTGMSHAAESDNVLDWENIDREGGIPVHHRPIQEGNQ